MVNGVEKKLMIKLSDSAVGETQTFTPNFSIKDTLRKNTFVIHFYKLKVNMY